MEGFVVCTVFVLVFGLANGGYLTRKHTKRLVGLPQGDVGQLPPNQWFLQKLDHFDSTNPGTWWQRYQTNETWFKNSRNSPVFLMIGGEGQISAQWMVQGAWMGYAEKYNALCFQLEHRFYGKSQPTGDLSTRSLRYLSSEQALADLAYFIDGMNQKYKLTSNNKWIVFGGSYPGSLAAWARLKYPHLIHAAVSSSGPVLAQLNFKSYDEVVKQSLTASSPQCAKNVHSAALQVADALQKPGMAANFTKKFNLCATLDLKEKEDVSNFIESLAGNFQGIVQYNKDNRITSNPITTTVDDLCNIMTNKSVGDLIDRYAAVNTLLNKDECIDVSYYDSIRELQNDVAPSDSRSWIYQTCTEFGWYQTSSSRQEIFGSGFNLQFFINQCKAIYGEDFDSSRIVEGIKRSNTIYGQKNIVDHVTNVIFVQGSLDPWHVLGVYKSTNNKAPAVLINGTAHCANMYPPASTDLPQLVEARKKIVEFIGECLSTEVPLSEK